METLGALETIEGLFEIGLKIDHMSTIKSVDGQGHPSLCLSEYLLLFEVHVLPLLHTHSSF